MAGWPLISQMFFANDDRAEVGRDPLGPPLPTKAPDVSADH